MKTEIGKYPTSLALEKIVSDFRLKICEVVDGGEGDSMKYWHRTVGQKAAMRAVKKAKRERDEEHAKQERLVGAFEKWRDRYFSTARAEPERESALRKEIGELEERLEGLRYELDRAVERAAWETAAHITWHCLKEDRR